MKGIIGKTTYWRYLLNVYPHDWTLDQIIRNEVQLLFPDKYDQQCDADELLRRLQAE